MFTNQNSYSCVYWLILIYIYIYIVELKAELRTNLIGKLEFESNLIITELKFELEPWDIGDFQLNLQDEAYCGCHHRGKKVLPERGRGLWGNFCSVARYAFVRIIISIPSIMDWRLHKMDVKITFFHGVIEEEVYVEQPQGWGTLGVSCLQTEEVFVWTSGMVFLGWWISDEVLVDLVIIMTCFWREQNDSRERGSNSGRRGCFRDRGSNQALLQCQRELTHEFEMKDLGLMHYFLD